ncbi:transcriptional regulator ERG homolog [Nematostella vectensis]|nr:transcriptional regulator ERG homolog [Nematostella vectensis]
METMDRTPSRVKQEFRCAENPDSPQTMDSEKRPRYKNTIHLWEFLLELLADERYSSLIAWSRKEYGEFKLKNQEEVAKRWGILKHRAGMNYEKLSRAIRYYYQQGIIKKVPGQRLVYKFGKLPYEFKPRNMKFQVDAEEPKEKSPTKPSFRHPVTESAFLSLTSLTPPPETGYQFGLPSPVARPVCTCYDCINTCIARTVHVASPLIYPTSGTVFSYAPLPVKSIRRSIPVSVITSTKS